LRRRPLAARHSSLIFPPVPLPYLLQTSGQSAAWKTPLAGNILASSPGERRRWSGRDRRLCPARFARGWAGRAVPGERRCAGIPAAYSKDRHVRDPRSARPS
jgi:hypothetical protein